MSILIKVISCCMLVFCAAVELRETFRPKKCILNFLIGVSSIGGVFSGTPLVNANSGIPELDGELLSTYRQGRSLEADGNFDDAQKKYESVVQLEPDYAYAWSSLGNVLTAKGNLDQALLCYRKALSLKPPKEEVSSVLLNKASIELAIDRTAEAISDLALAEKLSGPSQSIETVKAVALSNIGDWDESSAIFDKVIARADRYASPWWLRYAMSLLETRRATEAIAFLLRTVNRFPDEPECNVFAAALYTNIGSPSEALRYWNALPNDVKVLYRDIDFLKSKLKWGPTSITSLKNFLAVNGY